MAAIYRYEKAWTWENEINVLQDALGNSPELDTEMVTLADAMAAIAAERERCEQHFLAYAQDGDERIKDPVVAHDIAATLSALRGGEEARHRYVFTPSDPNRRGLPTIVAHERHPRP